MDKIKYLVGAVAGAIVCAFVLVPIGFARERTIYADAERSVREVIDGLESAPSDIKQYRSDLGTAIAANERVVEGATTAEGRLGNIEKGFGKLSSSDGQLRKGIGDLRENGDEIIAIAQEYRRRYEEAQK